MIPYVFKTAPFTHQKLAFDRSARKFFYAWLLDQGTGKTKLAIDNMAHLAENGAINGALILAPNDVHDQWASEQIPTHMPERIARRVAVWHASSKKSERACMELINKPVAGRLAILLMNHEALATKRGAWIATAFAKAYKIACFVDESHEFKSPKAARTKFLLNTLRPLCYIRRIMTGTPTEKPFDLFTQLYFLDPRIIGHDSYFTFTHQYGVFTKETAQRRDPTSGAMVRYQYESLQEYRQLDDLTRRLAPVSYRVKKEDCTDLPPKIYSPVHTHLSANQQKAYASMAQHGVLLLEQVEAGTIDANQALAALSLADLDEDELADRVQESAGRVSAKIKLVLELRLRQIAGGFTTDDDKRVAPLDNEPNPRMIATLRIIENALLAGEKIIVWAQFRAEIEYLCKLVQPLAQTLFIHGSVTGKERTSIIESFKDPAHTLRVLIAHPRTLGTGQNLQVARTVIYYSNGNRAIQRIQSEDRCHRIGQTGTVNIYDLIAAPCDQRTIDIVQGKATLNSALLDFSPQQLKALL